MLQIYFDPFRRDCLVSPARDMRSSTVTWYLGETKGDGFLRSRLASQGANSSHPLDRCSSKGLSTPFPPVALCALPPRCAIFAECQDLVHHLNAGGLVRRRHPYRFRGDSESRSAFFWIVDALIYDWKGRRRIAHGHGALETGRFPAPHFTHDAEQWKHEGGPGV